MPPMHHTSRQKRSLVKEAARKKWGPKWWDCHVLVKKARLAKAAQLVAHPCELNNSNVEHGKFTVYEGGQVYTV